TGASVSEVSGLRIKDCDLVAKCLHISPTPWRGLKTTNSQRSVPLSAEAVAALGKLIQNQTSDPEAPLFARYAKERGADSCSAMLMKRLRTVITDKKLTMHSLRHRMKDKLRNTGCPEAISLAILGHSTNTVAGIAKLLLAHCETLATVGSCRHFGGVIGPEVERISAGVAV
ncbi:Phage integrase family protein, partial [Lentibacter algarum]